MDTGMLDFLLCKVKTSRINVPHIKVYPVVLLLPICLLVACDGLNAAKVLARKVLTNEQIDGSWVLGNAIHSKTLQRLIWPLIIKYL